jgi:hypothetical protein
MVRPQCDTPLVFPIFIIIIIIIIIIQFYDVAFIVSHHHKQDLATIDNNFVENCQNCMKFTKTNCLKSVLKCDHFFFPQNVVFSKNYKYFPHKKQGMYNKIPFLFLELKFCDNPPERNYKEVKNT